jgi:hypothetical protein
MKHFCLVQRQFWAQFMCFVARTSATKLFICVDQASSTFGSLYEPGFTILFLTNFRLKAENEILEPTKNR